MSVLVHRVMCRQFSQCYDDANICFWTDGSKLNFTDAQAACQQRNDSFLARITNSYIQYKLGQFRDADNNTYRLLTWAGFWIDVSASGLSNFQWIDGSSLAGLHIFV